MTLACIICLFIGYSVGYYIHSIENRRDFYEIGIEKTKTKNQMEAEREQAIINWVMDEFPGYTVRNIPDPDDEHIRYISIYDICDEDRKKVNERIWQIIITCCKDFNLENDGEFSYIPSIHKHSDTVKFYPDFVRKKI